MTDKPFQSIDIAHLLRTLAKSHEQVAVRHGRIELTREGCDDICVIMSKAELESLERALEIFSDTVEYRSMCDNLSRIATECNDCGMAGEAL